MEIVVPWMIPKHCVDQTDDTGVVYTDDQLDKIYPFPTVYLNSVTTVYAPATFTQWSCRWTEQWFVETGAPTMSNVSVIV